MKNKCRILYAILFGCAFSCDEVLMPPSETSVPEIVHTGAAVRMDGSVLFSCTVNNKDAVSDLGFVLTPPDGGEGIRIPGEWKSSGVFQSTSECLSIPGAWTWAAFIGNGQELIYSETQSFLIEQFMIPPPDVPDGPASMLLRVDSGANQLVCLPLWGNVHVSIDWGDDNVEIIKGQFGVDTWVFHEYDSSGIFDVCIAGYADKISTMGDFFDMPESDKILAIVRWGDLFARNYTCAFRNCTRLEHVAADSLKVLTRAKTVESIFMNCKSLREIPDSLFAGYQGEDLSGLFWGCSCLETIPPHIFAGCLKTINYEGIFRECISLTGIPEELFADCVSAENFRYTFYGCQGLLNVPVSLFDHCLKANAFEETFYGCMNVAGESPYTVRESSKIHLYERKDYWRMFSVPSMTGGCFGAEFPYKPRWADNEFIPDTWK